MRFFTSDLHFDHKIVAITHRGFNSVEDHNQTIIDNINKMVRPQDELYILGDISMGSIPSIEHLRHLNGRKTLVAGNHDRAWPDLKPAQVNKYHHVGIDAIVIEMTIAIAGIPVTLNHFPFTADHTDPPRYIEHRPRDLGQFLLHGHLHSEQVMTSQREFHVGLDAHDLHPVSEKAIAHRTRRFYG